MKNFAFYCLAFLWLSPLLGQDHLLKSENFDHTYELTYLTNENKIIIYVLNNKRIENPYRLEFEINAPVSIVNQKIYSLIQNDQLNYHYKFPDSKLTFTLSDLKEETIVMAVQKSFKALPNEKEKLKFIETIANKLQITYDAIQIAKNKEAALLVKELMPELNINTQEQSLTKISDAEGNAIADTKQYHQYLVKLWEQTEKLSTKWLVEKDYQAIQTASFMQPIIHFVQLENLHATVLKKNTIKNYSYLGYLGTNFDLVDGVKAKNLFFATNILSKPDVENVGFYVSIYGNRTTSQRDSIPEALRPVVFDSINNTRYTATETSDLIAQTQSDNLGAFFSLFLRRWNLTKANSKNKIYYAPSLEFVWRRTFVQAEYRNRRLINIQEATNNPALTNNNNTQSFSYNIYDFYFAPLGLWLFQENDDISIRLNMNVGYLGRYISNNTSVGAFLNNNNSNFTKEMDVFYSGRLWITEPNTGITLQAEINNTFKRSRPFYGVTLSKAFNLDRIGSFLTPITSNNSK